MSVAFAPILISAFTGDALLGFLVPIVVYAKTQNVAMSGLAYFLEWLPRLLLTPIIGRWIDSWGIKTTSICSDVLKLFGCCIFLLVLFNSSDGTAIVVTAGIFGSLVALSNAQTMIVYEKFVAERSDNIERDANLISRADQIAMILGPLIGFCLFRFGAHWLILAAVPGYLTNLIFFLGKNFRRVEAGPQTGTASAQTVTKRKAENDKAASLHLWRFRYLFPTLGGIAFCGFFSNMLDGTVEATGVSVMFEKIHLSVEYFAFVNIAAGCAGTLSTIVLGKIYSIDREQMLLRVIIGLEFLAGLALCVFFGSFAGLLGFYALCIGLKIMRITLFRIYRIRVIPQEVFATLTSLMGVCAQLALPIVGLLVYFSKTLLIEPWYVMLVAALMVFVASIVIASRWRKNM